MKNSSMNSSLNLTAFLVEPRTPRGLFGYQVGSFDGDKTWLPLVLVSSKFTTKKEALLHAQLQVESAERALLRRYMKNTLKFKSPRQKLDDGGPGAA